MRGTAIAIVALLSVSLLGVACATSLEISVDESQDFSRYRTWDWLPGAARTIDAPTPHSGGLDRDLARLVERELERRGFERVRREADLRVGAGLKVRSEVVKVFETGAVEQVSSHHESPSYEVQATVERRETHQRSRLAVVAIDARRGKVVWRGTLEERLRGPVSPELKRMVAELLDHFPPAGRANESPPPDPDPGSGAETELTTSPSRSGPDV
jgi:hypothetical protein